MRLYQQLKYHAMRYRTWALLVLTVSFVAAAYGVGQTAPQSRSPKVQQLEQASRRLPERDSWKTPYDRHWAAVQLCQACEPCQGGDVPGVDCANSGCCAPRRGWPALGPVGFDQYRFGQYVGPARLEHVPEYRLRVDDQLNFIYRVTRNEQPDPYRINVGDQIQVESFTDRELNRALIVQPDGTITLRLLGQVHATGRTVDELRLALDEQYKKYYKVPAITVTPLAVNAKLEDLRYTIAGRSGLGGQSLSAKVTPEGTVTLPAVGVIPCQGLTLKELTEELAERYDAEIEGIEVIPILTQRAPRYVFVVGEVALPGRYTLEGPTTVMQAIAMAGSWNVGANVCQVVVFRRAEDWRLMATMLDLRPALLGKTPCPAGEIWVGDCDLVIVPKSKILLADNFIELVFTRGIYGVIPFSTNYSVTNLTTLAP